MKKGRQSTETVLLTPLLTCLAPMWSLLHDSYIRTIVPTVVDYYETDHYIFPCGWISCLPAQEGPKEYDGGHRSK